MLNFMPSAEKFFFPNLETSGEWLNVANNQSHMLFVGKDFNP